MLVLEELERAKARGAKIYAELAGYGVSSDAQHITEPDPTGVHPARAMQMALADAGIDAADIDYINAHGTSTPLGDASETRVIKMALGEENARKTPVSSTKGSTGHCLGAAGAVEAIFTTLAISEGMLPPTINYEYPDPECDLDYIPNEARPAEVDAAMSNSFGFGGHNASIVLKRYEGLVRSAMSDRWATFDCYGTLIDWNGGIARRARAAVRRRATPDGCSSATTSSSRDRRRRTRARRYREVLTRRSSGSPSEGSALPDGRGRTRSRARCRPGSRSPRCRPRSRRRAPAAGSSRSSRTPTATSSARRRRGSASRSTRRSSPPRSAPTSRGTATGRSSSRDARRPRPHVHVAREPLPRHRAGERARPAEVWINRLGESADPAPTRELPDLTGLADVAGRARPRRDDVRPLEPTTRRDRRRSSTSSTAPTSRSRTRSTPTRSAAGGASSTWRPTPGSYDGRDGTLAARRDADRARGDGRLDARRLRPPATSGRGLGSRCSLAGGGDAAPRRRARPHERDSPPTQRPAALIAAAASSRPSLLPHGDRARRRRPRRTGRRASRSRRSRPGEERALPRRHAGGVRRPLGPRLAGRSTMRRAHASATATVDPSLVYLVRDGDEVVAAEVNAVRFGAGWVDTIGIAKPWRRHGLGRALLLQAFGELYRRGERRVALAVDAGNETGATHLYESVGMRVAWQADVYEKRAVAVSMSRLRAKCPDCRTLTAVALGPEYQCHSCGREFGAGLVRVPRAWGDGRRGDGAGGALAAPVPGGGRRRRGHARRADARARLRAARAAARPRRLLLLARRRGRGARDAARPVRRRLGRRARRPEHARELAVRQRVGHAAADDPRRRRGRPAATLRSSARATSTRPSASSSREAGIHTGKHAVERALDDVDCVYVALDFDGLDEEESRSFMPEPGGIRLDEVERSCGAIAASDDRSRRRLHRPRPRRANVEPSTRLAAALGPVTAPGAARV